MPEAVAMLPGLREILQQFVGCEVVGVPEGFAAAAMSLIDLPEASGRGIGTAASQVADQRTAGACRWRRARSAWALRECARRCRRMCCLMDVPTRWAARRW